MLNLYFPEPSYQLLQPLFVGIDTVVQSLGNRYVTLLNVAKIVCVDCTDKRMSSSKTGLRNDEGKVQ